MSKSIVHLVLGGILTIIAAITAVNPLIMLAVCALLLLALASFDPDEPLCPARMGLMAIVFLIPLGGPGSYLASQMGGLNMTATKLLACLSLGYLIWSKAVSASPFASNRQTRLILWFAAIILVSYTLNDKSPYALDTIWDYSTAMLTFVLCINTVTRPRHVGMLLAVLLAGYVLSISIGMYRMPSGFGAAAAVARMRGASNGTSVIFGAGAAVCMLVAIYYAVTTHRWYRFVALLAIPVLLFGAVTAYARSVYIATFAGLLLLLFLLRSRIRPGHLVAGMLILTLIAIPMLDTARFLARISQIANHPAVDHSYGRRISYHTLGIELWRRSPLIGIGPGRFPIFFTSTEFRFDADTFSGETRNLHNMYLSTLCHTGIAGMLVLLLIIGTSIRDLLYVRRHAMPDDPSLARNAEMILVALLTTLLVAVFNPMDVYKLMWILFALAASLRGIHDERIRGISEGCQAQ